MSILPTSRKMRAAAALSALSLTAVVGMSIHQMSAAIGTTPFEDGPTATGAGEHLVLVLGGVFDSEQEALAAAAAMPFGDLQGFYVDSTNNYSLEAVYAQASPDDVVVDCDSAGSIATDALAGADPDGAGAVLGQGVVTQICANVPDNAVDRQAVKVAVPVDLFQVPADVAKAVKDGTEPRPEACVNAADVCLSNVFQYVDDSLALAANKHVLVSAFRTKAGAEDFMELIRQAGATVAAVQAVKLAGPFVGLGQEPDPLNAGPLLDPLPNQQSYQS